LQKEVDTYDKQIKELDIIHKAHLSDRENTDKNYYDKLKDLEIVRARQNEEIKKLSSEFNKVQSELNTLIIEFKKYDSQV
jgi:hypothetical protein